MNNIYIYTYVTCMCVYIYIYIYIYISGVSASILGCRSLSGHGVISPPPRPLRDDVPQSHAAFHTLFPAQVIQAVYSILWKPHYSLAKT